MTKIKSGKSKDNRPGHKKYVLEKRWLENKKKKVAKYNREVERQRERKTRRMERASGIDKNRNNNNEGEAKPPKAVACS